MFALEITFGNGSSNGETVFVRRPQALIGAQDFAHVVIDDMASVPYQIRVVRESGRRFRCAAVPTDGAGKGPGKPPDRAYDGEAFMDLGPVALRVTALDVDLLVRENEPPDKAGVRALRTACASKSPVFPAVAVLGAYPMVMSFGPSGPLLVGRSKECGLRLDSSAISARHAKIGFEEGRFWIEDLGSTNGTFVNQQQIAGRAAVAAGVPVVLGREISVVCVASAEGLAGLGGMAEDALARVSEAAAAPKFPLLVSCSEVARPSRLALVAGSPVSVGRDQESDVWLGAPHVSRTHCTVLLEHDGSVVVSDRSTNGTAYGDGILRRGQSLTLDRRPLVLDFGGGVTLGLCFDEADEERFTQCLGSPSSFATSDPPVRRGTSEPVPVRARAARAAPPPRAPVVTRLYKPLRRAGPLGIVIVTVSFVFAVFLIVSLLRGVFV